MKTYRQREKQGTKVVDSTKGPDEAKIKVRLGFLFKVYYFNETSACVHSWIGCVFQTLLERTGYTLDVTTGQRKYGGPPPESVYTGAQPTVGTEVIHIRTVALVL